MSSDRIFTKAVLGKLSIFVTVALLLLILTPSLQVTAEIGQDEDGSEIESGEFAAATGEKIGVAEKDPQGAVSEASSNSNTSPPGDETSSTNAVAEPSSEEGAITESGEVTTASSDNETTASQVESAGGGSSESSESTEPIKFTNPTASNDPDEPLGLVKPFGMMALGVSPTATVGLSATPGEILATGGSVTYTVTVHNTSTEPIELTDISDNPVSGVLTALSDVAWSAATTVAAGDTISGRYQVTYLEANLTAGTPVVNTVTVGFTTAEPLTGTAISHTTSVVVLAVEDSFGDPAATFTGFNGGVAGGGSWTTGNLGKTYAEGEWVPFQLVLTDVQNSWGPDLIGMNQYHDQLLISYDFTNGGNRFMDMARSIQVGEVALSNAQAYPEPDGDPMPIGTRALLEYAQIDHPGGPVDIEYAWDGFTLLKSTDSFDYHTQVHQLLPADPSSDDPDTDYEADRRCIIITRQNLIDAGLGDADTIVIYFQLHLSRTLFWQTDLHTQMSIGPRTPPWGGFLYDEPDPKPKNGSGFVSGSSGHAALVSFGQKTVPLPVPPEKPGSVTGYKYNDLTGNGPSPDDTPLAGWDIDATIAFAGVPFTMKATTDSNGQYTFPYVSYGTWMISERLEGPYEETYPASEDDAIPGIADAIATDDTYEPEGVIWAPYSWIVVIDDFLAASGVNFYNFLKSCHECRKIEPEDLDRSHWPGRALYLCGQK